MKLVDPMSHKFTPKDRKAFHQFCKVMQKRLKAENEMKQRQMTLEKSAPPPRATKGPR